jgi:hypothetical protein
MQLVCRHATQLSSPWRLACLNPKPHAAPTKPHTCGEGGRRRLSCGWRRCAHCCGCCGSFMHIWYSCTNTHTHTHTHTRRHTHTHTQAQTDTQTDTHAHAHTCPRTCTNAHVIYTFIHVRSWQHSVVIYIYYILAVFLDAALSAQAHAAVWMLLRDVEKKIPVRDITCFSS